MAANTMIFEWDRERIALHQETIFYRLHAWMKKEHKMHFQKKYHPNSAHFESTSE